MGAYLDSWRRFADFSGRTSRRDYWVACFIGYGIYCVYSIICGVLCMMMAGSMHLSLDQMSSVFTFMQHLYGTAWLVPYFAMTVRRLRDAGYHTKLLLLWIIPPVGMLAIIVRLFMKSVDADEVTQNS